jgi:predicted RNase H-like HicB family nuclease
MIQEALDFHFEGMRKAGLPIPMPTAFSAYVGSATA